MNTDPSAVDVISVALQLGALITGSALLAGGVTKLKSVDTGAAAVLAYRVVPAKLAAAVAVAIGAAEVVVGLGIILGVAVALAFGVILLAAFTLVAISALVRGLDIDCHCAGEGERLGPSTLARNVVFAVTLAAPLMRGDEVQAAGLNLDLAGAFMLGLAACLCLASVAALRLLRVSRLLRRRPYA